MAEPERPPLQIVVPVRCEPLDVDDYGRVVACLIWFDGVPLGIAYAEAEYRPGWGRI